MLLTKTCYYWENQVFGGATNQDMSLIETCFYSRLYGKQNTGLSKTQEGKLELVIYVTRMSWHDLTTIKCSIQRTPNRPSMDPQPSKVTKKSPKIAQNVIVIWNLTLLKRTTKRQQCQWVYEVLASALQPKNVWAIFRRQYLKSHGISN